MTNTHRKTTTRTTARIAAVGAFGIGAAIALPGLAAAQEAPSGSLEGLTAEQGSLSGNDDGSLQGALGTDLNVDLGSLTLDLNLDAEAPTPGSVEFGSLGVSPNTGSALLDGGSAGGDEGTGGQTADESGSLGGALAGLSSGAGGDDTAPAAAADTGSLG